MLPCAVVIWVFGMLDKTRGVDRMSDLGGDAAFDGPSTQGGAEKTSDERRGKEPGQVKTPCFWLGEVDGHNLECGVDKRLISHETLKEGGNSCDDERNLWADRELVGPGAKGIAKRKK